MLLARLATAAVLGPPVIAGVIFLSASGFALLIGGVVAIGAWEWARLAGLPVPLQAAYAAALVALMLLTRLFDSPGIGEPWSLVMVGILWWGTALALLLTYSQAAAAWRGRLWRGRLLIGCLILLPAWASFMMLRGYPDSAFVLLLLLFAVWGADTGAYVFGRALGRHHLAPSVSPGKTWEGLVSGLLVAGVIALAAGFLQTTHELSWADRLVLVLLVQAVVLVSVVGDLTISLFKRYRGIKDTSRLLPGHGGVLDRIDSLLAAGPAFVVALALYHW